MSDENATRAALVATTRTAPITAQMFDGLAAKKGPCAALFAEASAAGDAKLFGLGQSMRVEARKPPALLIVRGTCHLLFS